MESAALTHEPQEETAEQEIYCCPELFSNSLHVLHYWIVVVAHDTDHNQSESQSHKTKKKGA